ncbi:cytochrome P460 family protein [Robertmurraya sp. FSL R5-0851]|uniref:cytochrome P460 family protein n=1 Tax=Robertmurraya sp. FSL R5-0851 TaxID=2921584 RepID=UPI0030F5985F
MKRPLIQSLVLMMSLVLTACNVNNERNDISNQQEAADDTSGEELSESGRELVQFPENYDKGINYTTVNRGNVREELYTSRDAIEAVQNGQPFPSGTVITLEIYRDEELSEIFVMEKRTGWGEQNPSEMRNGDWLYQEFNGDKSVDYEEDIGRCFSCHANRERDDFVNTLDDMKSYELDNATGLKKINIDSQIEGISAHQWEVKAVDDSLDDLGSGLVGEKEKTAIIQKVLLITHFNQET